MRWRPYETHRAQIRPIAILLTQRLDKRDAPLDAGGRGQVRAVPWRTRKVPRAIWRRAVMLAMLGTVPCNAVKRAGLYAETLPAQINNLPACEE